jgi:hypothetical protein
VLVFAHAGHWLASLIYAAPVLVLGGWLALDSWKQRRRTERGQRRE